MIRLAAAAVLALTGCARPAVPPVASQGEGRPTIVSLNPCTDAILAELMGPERLLAISHYSQDPRATSMDIARARRFRATGGTVEEVLALDPDVVVASSFLAPATRAALEELGIAVTTVGIAASVDDSIAQIRQLADLSGEQAAGERLAARVAAAARPVAGPRRTAVLWQAGGIVPGGDALVSELLDRAGFDNHTAARGLGQASYLPLEQVLADPPDLLLVAGSEVGQSHPALERVPDMRRARFDPSLVYCGGPTIIRAMQRLRELRRT
ncbi:ABC transporter substrate-binding protein [Qipengyuania sp. MTN3-11]|uniref:ABC transporter substrate-binding protein n=1 Tax=Qipengyuania sp. MTN3-11 TaxID=3056557 RepID=UPI0036F40A9F